MKTLLAAVEITAESVPYLMAKEVAAYGEGMHGFYAVIEIHNDGVWWKTVPPITFNTCYKFTDVETEYRFAEVELRDFKPIAGQLSSTQEKLWAFYTQVD